MHRRAFLAAGVTAAAAGVAGCRSTVETRSARAPPLVEDRPEAVYYPTHTEGMEVVGTGEAGDYAVALTYSFPHRFWLVNGDRTNQVEVEGADTMHMMTVVWDPETGTVVPSDNVSATVTRKGETIADRRLWAMLSQRMGVHAGDNVSLDGDGTYRVRVDVGPLSVRRTGAFADRFGDGGTAEFTVEFSQSAIEELTFERITDRQGDPGAVEPMDMDMSVPVAELPVPEGMPGRLLGTAETGGARVVASGLDSPPSGVDADGEYLAVSPRAPYNRYPLAMMSVSATLQGDGETRFEDTLTPTFDPDLGYHYGAAVDRLAAGDDLALGVETPPQVARHEGYETAFLDFPDATIPV